MLVRSTWIEVWTQQILGYERKKSQEESSQQTLDDGQGDLHKI